MARRSNHYEAAFEAYLRSVRIPYVAVDEQRRTLLRDASLKSLDFIVYSEHGENLLVDVKGRRFPSGESGSGRKWENWASTEDVEALLRWQEVFGAGFRAAFVFAYHVIEPALARQFETTFDFRERVYAFFGVWADQYQDEMRARSAKWDTVSLRSQAWRQLRAPIGEFL